MNVVTIAYYPQSLFVIIVSFISPNCFFYYHLYLFKFSKFFFPLPFQTMTGCLLSGNIYMNYEMQWWVTNYNLHVIVATTKTQQF